MEPLGGGENVKGRSPGEILVDLGDRDRGGNLAVGQGRFPGEESVLDNS